MKLIQWQMLSCICIVLKEFVAGFPLATRHPDCHPRTIPPGWTRSMLLPFTFVCRQAQQPGGAGTDTGASCKENTKALGVQAAHEQLAVVKCFPSLSWMCATILPFRAATVPAGRACRVGKPHLCVYIA